MYNKSKKFNKARNNDDCCILYQWMQLNCYGPYNMYIQYHQIQMIKQIIVTKKVKASRREISIQNVIVYIPFVFTIVRKCGMKKVLLSNKNKTSFCFILKPCQFYFLFYSNIQTC